MIKRRDKYGLFLSIIFGICCHCFLYFYTIPTETTNLKGISMATYLNIIYLNNHPVFNYFNGIWLMFAGLLFFCIIIILEIPEEHQLLKEKIKQRIKKYKS
jgi:glucan phosphoethanolaminetransferase (alkaline phosphatase superfamily)